MNPQAGAAPPKAGAPANLLDNAYAASGMAYTLAAGGKPDPGWKQETYPPGSPKGKALGEAQAVELVAPNGIHFVAFKGTTEANLRSGGDMRANLGNFVGADSVKYDAAARLGEAYRGENVVMTGHSLGGGLAKTAAAVGSDGPPGGKDPDPVVCVTFNAAPVNFRTVERHGVDPEHIKSEMVQVVNRHDALNRVVAGGKLSFGKDGAPIEAREGPNDVVVVAEGKGSGVSLAGHKLSSLEDPNHPGTLVTSLSTDNHNPIDKARFDALVAAREATSNAPRVVSVLEAVRGPERPVERGNDGR